MREPDYLVEDLFSDSYENIVVVADPHLSGLGTSNRLSPESAADHVNSYAESYDAEVVILGDIESRADAEKLLENLENDTYLVTGDEDVGRVGESFNHGLESEYLEEVAVDVLEMEVNGLKAQFSHFPTQRERHSNGDYFSTRWIDHTYARSEAYPSMQDLDFVGWADKHIDFPQLLGDTVSKGFGSYTRNYNQGEEMPEASINVLSFGDGIVENLHYNSLNDELFEHIVFDIENELMIFKEGFIEAEKRFSRDKINTVRSEDIAPSPSRNRVISAD